MFIWYALSAYKPSIPDISDVEVEFLFSNIERMSIYEVDDYPYEKYSQSSFDLVEDVQKEGIHHIVLSTYD